MGTPRVLRAGRWSLRNPRGLRHIAIRARRSLDREEKSARLKCELAATAAKTKSRKSADRETSARLGGIQSAACDASPIFSTIEMAGSTSWIRREKSAAAMHAMIAMTDMTGG